MRKNWSNRIIGISLFATLLCACSQKQGSDPTKICDSQTNQETSPRGVLEGAKTCVMSDDSLITVYWWDTGEGGSAPQIEAVCRFKTETGEVKEITTPLLSLIHPDDDYGHHEVEKIVSLDTEYGNRVYFFYLRAKVGSNKYAHDLISMVIKDDNLVPTDVMLEKTSNSHISLDLSR